MTDSLAPANQNVPNKLVDTEVMQFIEEVVGRSFDFFYLRTDYATGVSQLLLVFLYR
jgi:hypothetical protein